MTGPKGLQRFVLIWLILMGLLFYGFVHESFDGSAEAAHLPRQSVPSPVHR
jgi:hypothetical protein